MGHSLTRALSLLVTGSWMADRRADLMVLPPLVGVYNGVDISTASSKFCIILYQI